MRDCDSVEEAQAFLECIIDVNEPQGVSNKRYSFTGNRSTMASFKQKQRKDAPHKFDAVVTVLGKKYIMGFDYVSM